MADIQFKEEQFARATPYATVAPSGIRGLVIRSGLASDEKSANAMLLGITVLAIVLAVGVYFLTQSSSGTLTTAQQAQLQKLQAAQSGSH